MSSALAAGGPLDRALGGRWRRGLVFLLVVAAVEAGTLDEPPVWDAAMGLFPAAITLARSGLDYGHLLAQPTYHAGGPNIHVASPVTLGTALVYLATGPRSDLALPILHGLHYAVAAVALSALWSLARRVGTVATASSTVALTLLLPLVQAQMGGIYLEVPLLALTALAILSALDRRPVATAICCALAVLVKPTGMAVGVAIAAAAVFADGPWRERWRRAAPPLLATAAAALAYRALVVDEAIVSDPRAWAATRTFLAAIPDVVALVGLAPAAALLWRRWRRPPPPTGELVGIVAWLSLGFFAFFAFLDLTGTAIAILPRYLVAIAPLSILVASLVFGDLLPRRTAALAFAITALLLVVNRTGRLYPYREASHPVLAERSLAYRDLLALQRRGTREIAALTLDAPAYVARPTAYRLLYPEMGYVESTPGRWRSIGDPTLAHDGRLERFPPRFHLLLEYPILGGEMLAHLGNQAAGSSAYTVELRRLEAGRFAHQLVTVERRAAPPPAR